ncbi:MAG: DUF6318 family protein [Actinomycetota bacterium]|nr:DUF6318 family protein [Actinomycetota bacterium]
MGDQLRTATIALLVGTALLSGCSQRQEASTTLPSASAAPTTSAEALPPLGPPNLPMPTEARAKTPEGAEAFLRYYMEVYNHAQRTVDPTYMRQLSSGCELCTALADTLQSDAAAGYAYEGGEVRLDHVSRPFLRDDQQAEIAFAVTQDTLTVTKDGDPVEGLTYGGTSSKSDGAILRWNSAQTTWSMAQWDAA